MRISPGHTPRRIFVYALGWILIASTNLVTLGSAAEPAAPSQESFNLILPSNDPPVDQGQSATMDEEVVTRSTAPVLLQPPKFLLTSPLGKRRFTEHKIEGMGGLTMVVRQSQGTRRIPLGIAKREIRKINDANPVIREAVDTLVANSTESTTEKKREKAILGVYLNNDVYKKDVDGKLSRL